MTASTAPCPPGTTAPADELEPPVTPFPLEPVPRGPAGAFTGCAYEDCDDRSVVVVKRAGARRGRLVCDRHAHAEVLLAERYGYDVTLTACVQVQPRLF